MRIPCPVHHGECPPQQYPAESAPSFRDHRNEFCTSLVIGTVVIAYSLHRTVEWFLGQSPRRRPADGLLPLSELGDDQGPIQAAKTRRSQVHGVRLKQHFRRGWGCCSRGTRQKHGPTWAPGYDRRGRGPSGQVGPSGFCSWVLLSVLRSVRARCLECCSCCFLSCASRDPEAGGGTRRWRWKRGRDCAESNVTIIDFGERERSGEVINENGAGAIQQGQLGSSTRRSSRSRGDSRGMGEGGRSSELVLDEKWDAAIDLTLRRFVYSTAGGAVAALTLFRSPTTRWSAIAFGAGLGLGSALRDSSYIFNGSKPLWPFDSR